MEASDIQQEYERLGYSRGWSFLRAQAARLDDAKVLIIGLNPGGLEGGGHWDCPQGNAFYVQHWNSDETDFNPLQRQVHRMHEILGVSKHETLAANLVPFRSPSWNKLNQPEQAVAFGRRLMGWLLERTKAPLVTAFGARTAEELRSLMGATQVADDLPSGWGKVTLGRYVAPDGRVLVRLPHLSRYQIFGREGEAGRVAEASLKSASAPV